MSKNILDETQIRACQNRINRLKENGIWRSEEWFDNGDFEIALNTIIKFRQQLDKLQDEYTCEECEKSLEDKETGITAFCIGCWNKMVTNLRQQLAEAETKIELLREITEIKDPEQHFEQIMAANKFIKAELEKANSQNIAWAVESKKLCVEYRESQAELDKARAKIDYQMGLKGQSYTRENGLEVDNKQLREMMEKIKKEAYLNPIGFKGTENEISLQKIDKIATKGSKTKPAPDPPG